jgi:hypothetical protein
MTSKRFPALDVNHLANAFLVGNPLSLRQNTAYDGKTSVLGSIGNSRHPESCHLEFFAVGVRKTGPSRNCGMAHLPCVPGFAFPPHISHLPPLSKGHPVNEDMHTRPKPHLSHFVWRAFNRVSRVGSSMAQGRLGFGSPCLSGNVLGYGEWEARQTRLNGRQCCTLEYPILMITCRYQPFS